MTARRPTTNGRTSKRRPAHAGDQRPSTDTSACRAGCVSKNDVAAVRAASIEGALQTADSNVWPKT